MHRQVHHVARGGKHKHARGEDVGLERSFKVGVVLLILAVVVYALQLMFGRR